MNRREFVSTLSLAGVVARTHAESRRDTNAAVDKLVFATATDLAALIRSRNVTAPQVLNAHLEQIETHNRKLNAIVTLNAALARQRAKEADEALGRGEIWGPLHGVPVTLEDAHATSGIRSTFGGFPKFKDYVPTEDGTIAARLKAGGAIIVGKTNGPTVFPDSVFPRTNNPWNVEHTPGGSSAGPAAALAAGLTPFDVGLDTLGSIVNPAHYCGVYGMRPTERRIPLTGTLFIDDPRLWRVMSVAGPMARSVEDLELGLRLLSGPDGRDAEVPAVPWQESKTPFPTDLRIAWTPSLGLHVSADIRAAVTRFAEALRDSGGTVLERLPDVDLSAQKTFGESLFDIIVGAQDKTGSTLHDYFDALQRRDSYISQWDRFFREWDVFICPAGPITAEPHDAVEITIDTVVIPKNKLSELAISSTLSPVSGCPAVVMPLETDRRGLPIGVLLMARRWYDERLLAIARLATGLTKGFRRPPGY